MLAIPEIHDVETRHPRDVDAGYLSIRQSVAREKLLTPNRTTNPRHVEVAYEALRIADHGAHSPDFIEIALDVIQPEIDRRWRMVATSTNPAAARRKPPTISSRRSAPIGGSMARSIRTPRNTQSKAFWFWILAGPALIGCLAFSVLPMVESLWLSFTKYDVISAPSLSARETTAIS